jgi:hypothetical protein
MEEPKVEEVFGYIFFSSNLCLEKAEKIKEPSDIVNGFQLLASVPASGINSHTLFFRAHKGNFEGKLLQYYRNILGSDEVKEIVLSKVTKSPPVSPKTIHGAHHVKEKAREKKKRTEELIHMIKSRNPTKISTDVKDVTTSPPLSPQMDSKSPKSVESFKILQVRCFCLKFLRIFKEKVEGRRKNSKDLIDAVKERATLRNSRPKRSNTQVEENSGSV